MNRSVACLLLVLLFGSADAQERQVLLGEITKKPEGREGDWVVKGRTLIAERNSDIDTSEFAVVGNLAIVEFFTIDSVSTITVLRSTPMKVSDIVDGPYVMWRDQTTAEVLSMKEGKVQRKLLENVTGSLEVNDLSPLVPSIVINPKSPEPLKAQWDSPEKLMAISDLEGNYLHALRFLQNHEVLDENGHWSWGAGHLVLVGDLVDRGASVTETLWLIRRLEREADAAGGKVHYVLGNHEAMVMAGDLRYIHPKYHFVAEQYGIAYEDLHGPDSEIGRWLRSKNAVVRVGDLLFVHGGYSPALDQEKIEPDRLNELVRSQLGRFRMEPGTVGTDPVGHRYGPFWYRGYFPRYSETWGGQPTQEQMQTILDRHQAKHVVVGHTVVDEVGPVDESGMVIAIDTKWADSKKCQGLLQEDGKLYRLLMTGEREEILAKVKQ